MTVAKAPVKITIAFGLALLLPGCVAYGPCGIRECGGDSATSAEVRQLLHQQPALGVGGSIDVRTYGGVVYLYGLVDTEMERSLAQSMAREAHGAVRVVNLLGVQNGSR